MLYLKVNLAKQFYILLILGLLLPLFQVNSQIPKTVLYQGTLTDNNGLPVPDGTYFIRFRIWSDSINTDIAFEKWNGNIQSINVLGGLLEVKLGAPPMPSLPSEIFSNDTNLYLGLTVEPAPELRPRIKFTAVPYAYKALIADTASVALGVVQNSITGAGIVDGSVELKKLRQESAETGEVITWDGSNWVPAPGPATASKIDSISVGGGLGGGGDSGVIPIYVLPEGITAVHLAPNSVGGSEIQANAVGAVHILPSAVGQSELASSSVGTSEIGDNSIFGVDIADEPGLVQSRNTNLVSLDNLAMTDLVSVTITTPYPGFIFLTGRVNLRVYGATNSSIALVQIDEVAGGTELAGHYSSVGFSSYPTTGDYKFSCSNQRVFQKNAGTYTFRLEGRKLISNVLSQIEASSAILTALYFPTAYGGVQPVGEKTVEPEVEQ